MEYFSLGIVTGEPKDRPERYECMVAYEFYVRDDKRGKRLLGILPERRKTQERVSEESVMNWAKQAFSGYVEMHDVYFIRVILEENGSRPHSIRGNSIQSNKGQ